MHFDYFIWCVSCSVVVLTCFVICECMYVWVCVCMGFIMCVCVCVCAYGFRNVWVCVRVGFVMCGCVYACLGVLLICVLVFTVFLYCVVRVYLFLFVTSVRTTATE